MTHACHFARHHIALRRDCSPASANLTNFGDTIGDSLRLPFNVECPASARQRGMDTAAPLGDTIGRSFNASTSRDTRRRASMTEVSYRAKSLIGDYYVAGLVL